MPTEGAHPVIEPLLFAQGFYRMANALTLASAGTTRMRPRSYTR